MVMGETVKWRLLSTVAPTESVARMVNVYAPGSVGTTMSAPGVVRPNQLGSGWLAFLRL